MPNRKILVNDIRVRGTGRTMITEDKILPSFSKPAIPEKVSSIFNNQ